MNRLADLFKRKVTEGRGTAAQASGDNRQAYLQYVDAVTRDGKRPKTYDEWLKSREAE